MFPRDNKINEETLPVIKCTITTKIKIVQQNPLANSAEDICRVPVPVIVEVKEHMPESRLRVNVHDGKNCLVEDGVANILAGLRIRGYL
jgi:hypothetical protein